MFILSMVLVFSNTDPPQKMSNDVVYEQTQDFMSVDAFINDVLVFTVPGIHALFNYCEWSGGTFIGDLQNIDSYMINNLTNKGSLLQMRNDLLMTLIKNQSTVLLIT